MPFRDPLKILLYHANRNDVDTVIVDGQVLMQERRILTVDEDEVISKANEAAQRIWKKAESEIDNRWASRAWDVSRTIPAAKIYHKALGEIEAGKNYEAMQLLQKVTMMEDAGHYATLAAKKIEELKAAWRKR